MRPERCELSVRKVNNMDWTEKMIEAMRMLHEACKANEDWTECSERCPFDAYCDAFLSADLGVPSEEFFMRDAGLL